MTDLTRQIAALLDLARAPQARKGHPKGPKYHYVGMGGVVTKNSGGAGTPANHRVVRRVINPDRGGKY